MTHPNIEALAHPLRIDRNIKRLQINVREYSAKLADIENTYPMGDCSKMVREEYDMLYSLYVEDSKTLEELLNIKGVQL